MLEYLFNRQGLYPYYPQVELLDLRKRYSQMASYRQIAAELMSGRELDDVVSLLSSTLLKLVDDQVLCNSYTLMGLLLQAKEPLQQQRILHRMRTWRDFDRGSLE